MKNSRGDFMDWVRDFDLFLFDFDGLLVNTEPLHYQAYVNMCQRRGFSLQWSFSEFCSYAHVSSDLLQKTLRDHLPDLFEQEPNWKILYAEKKKEYLGLLNSGAIRLMPGVHDLLQALERENIDRIVVTHSPKEQTDFIRVKQPILGTIPHWLTREDYEKPKPDPECYLRAIELFGRKKNKIIGFEDSVRGITALRKTPALAVLICPNHHPLLETVTDKDVLHFESIDLIPKDHIHN